MWLDSGDIVLIADSEGVRDTYEATGSALEPSAPLTVLVNRGTASASEVGNVIICPGGSGFRASPTVSMQG